jgi:ribosome biogenesis GTPase
MDELREGRVLRLDAKRCFVDLGDRSVVCQFRGRLFEDLKGHHVPFVVGDRVRVRCEGEEGVVEEVLPRSSRFAKPSSRDGRAQILAANVDLLVIVAALASPPLRTGAIDRFLVVAEREGITPLIVLNKLDLGEREKAEQVAESYRALGYEVILSSVTTGEGIPEIRARLEGHLALFVGHSGVGKSSLLNRLDERLGLRVADVSEKHQKGRHTTTNVVLHGLGPDTYVVDSPGVREIQVPDMPGSAELGLYFPEIRKRLPNCRYPDCTHSHEPDCAVKAAVDEGSISRDRYESYLRILAGEGRQPRHDSY